MKYLLLLTLVVSCAHNKNRNPRYYPDTHASQTSPSKKYVRKNWPHWSDRDKNCLNTRQEILKARSLVPVTFNKKGCTVVKGKWNDYYYPETHTLAKEVDIDHLVPLKHAHDHGAAEWTRTEKEMFANDPENLVITYRKYNRDKGPKSIAEWLPVNKEYACKYMHDWMKIKTKYHLVVEQKEQDTIKMSGCPGF